MTGSAFIHFVTWLRLVPDVIFASGVLALVAFVARAIVIDRRDRRITPAAPPARPIKAPERELVGALD